MQVDELLLANKHLDFITAVKLLSWINKTVIPKNSDGEFENRILDILKKREDTYNPAKGNLLSYLKTSINYDMINMWTKPKIDYYNIPNEQEVTVDMSVFTDSHIMSLYRVSKGVGSLEDIDIVKGLVRD